jgi:two-component system chemotaxis response regulator CheY
MVEVQTDSKKLKRKILVVDDFANMRRTIRNMLKQMGYVSIDEADDGDAAIEKLRVGAFDLVICDWNMPQMPGISVLREVRRDPKLRDLSFVMVTAENWEEEIVEAAEEFVDGYIIKPFVTKTLEEKINQVWEFKVNPSKGESLFLKGLHSYFDGKLDEAKDYFKQVLDIKKKSAKTHSALGTVYLEKGELDDAEKHFKQAVSYNPHYVKAYHGLAEVQHKKKELDEAIQNLETAVKKSPRISERQIFLGDLYLEKNNMAKALHHYQKAAEVERAAGPILMKIANLHLKKKDTDQAYDALVQALGSVVQEDSDQVIQEAEKLLNSGVFGDEFKTAIQKEIEEARSRPKRVTSARLTTAERMETAQPKSN